MTSGDASGFRLHNADSPRVPLLLTVPHAGRDYPDDLIRNSRIPATELIRLEDRYADRLVQPAIAAGIPVIVAHRARAWIDLNRAESELDSSMIDGWTASRGQSPSFKMRGGLGLIPRRLSGAGELWKRPLSAHCVEARIDSYYRPFHANVAETLRRMRERFGIAILLDIHSMPPLAPRNGGEATRAVVGDRFGQSAASLFSELLVERLRSAGIAAGLNHPYPGDHILRTHGNIARNIHAIQLELDRSLYLDAALREPVARLGGISGLVCELAEALIEQAVGSAEPIAAE